MWVARIREVFVAQHAVDFRKGADALIAECYAMVLNPYLCECDVFVHRSRRMVKVIGGDTHEVLKLGLDPQRQETLRSQKRSHSPSR